MSRSLYARLHRRFGKRISGKERKERIDRRIAGFRAAHPVDELLADAGLATPGRPRAVVVGAGFAGLMAGHCLSKTHHVTVLEARDRVGGRVWTLSGAEGRLIEGGAELIGYSHHLWMMLAAKFELGLSVLTSDDDSASMGLELPLFLDGRLLTAAELEQTYNEMTTAYDAFCRKAVKEVTDPNRPWLSPDAEKNDRRPLSDWIARQDCTDLTKASMEADWANNNGAPTRLQSYLANQSLIAGCAKHGQPDDFYNFCENARSEQGNQALATALARRITRAGGEVRLGTPVSAIDLTGDGVAVTAAGGETVPADVVVLATPPTAWPTVNPDPGPDCRVTMGHVVKYLSDTPERFWIGEKLSPSSTSEAYGMTWEGTDNQIGRPPELSLFAGGDAANNALAADEKGEVHAFYDRGLEEVYAGYSKNRSEWPRFMAWPREPWTMTGYSCPAPGDVCRVWPHYAKAYGPGGKLHFAGEHTSPGFFGYMEGALQGGFFAAARILRKDA